MNVGDGGIAVVTCAERLRRGVACILASRRFNVIWWTAASLQLISLPLAVDSGPSA
jgi:hypothetical protein